ncbi:MAG: hypothetical protein JXA87_04715 [Thermoleophilia bacterium]|nr:hypothetical protein [Thermoleophilia bacterium]
MFRRLLRLVRGVELEARQVDRDTVEEAGKLRRGYFVEGLGGAQFAYPGTVDRLRRVRDEDTEAEVVALAAADPANPYGWLLPWPPLSSAGAASAADGASTEDASAGQATVRGTLGPRRAVGAAVVLVGGVPVLYLDRNARRHQPGTHQRRVGSVVGPLASARARRFYPGLSFYPHHGMNRCACGGG